MKRIIALLIAGLFLLVNSTAIAVDYKKSSGAVKLDWTLLDDTGSDTPFVDSGDVTTTNDIQVELHIDVAHRDTNAVTAPGVTVSIWTRAGATDESWHLFTKYTCCTATSVTVALNATSGSGESNEALIQVASTADWDTGELEVLFLDDNDAIANGAVVVIKGWSDNDHYTATHNLINTYASGDDLFDDVSQQVIILPAGTIAYKVYFHNADADATYAVRVEETKVTDIE